MDDLSEDKIKWFLGMARRERQYPFGEDTPVADVLAHLNLLDDGQPTHAAVLLFGRNPQRFLLTSEVKCMHFHGLEVRKPIPSYQVYRGTVFELVDQAVDFVMSKINRTVGTRALGPQAPVEYELPREAVAEAIVNAVAHRDYTSNASVQVMLFADRLEVWNPGELPAALTIELLFRPHASIPRNPLIAEPMFLARYAEKAGSGILDMIALCREAGLPAPVPGVNYFCAAASIRTVQPLLFCLVAVGAGGLWETRSVFQGVWEGAGRWLGVAAFHTPAGCRPG